MSESLPPIDRALLPAAVRDGDAQRKQDYQAALAFERVLVGQMTEAMTKGADALGSDDEPADAATAQLKQTLPQTLADALMSAGGIGLAAQLDTLWHPEATSTSVSQTAAQAQQGGGGASAGSAAA